MDEWTFYRINLYKESTANCLLMIQPMLFEYCIDTEQGLPVLCDIESFKEDIILVSDNYFNIVAWNGLSVASWKKEKLHLQSEYSYLKNFYEQPLQDIQIFKQGRIPAPKFVECDQGSPNERLIKSRLNPSESVNYENFFTDDIPLKVFMKHLCEVTVKTE